MGGATAVQVAETEVAYARTCGGGGGGGADVHHADTVVRGRLRGPAPDGGVVHFYAAAPAERRASFTGSGLPFATAEQAFFRTPNRGTLAVGPDGAFEARLRAPNAYAVGLGTALVPPTLYLWYTSGGARYEAQTPVGDVAVPFRALTWPQRPPAAARKDATFYTPVDVFVRSQEQILRDGAYPDEPKMPPNFWGLRPPL